MKENAPQQRKGYAAELRRKQQLAAASQAATSTTSLPRVAGLAAARHSLRSPLTGGNSERPRGNRPQKPRQEESGATRAGRRSPVSSAQRVGFKPATHSTCKLVPLLDVTAKTPATATSRSVAQLASQAPYVTTGTAEPVLAASPELPAFSPTPAHSCSSMRSGVVVDPALDSEEERLQAELELVDRQLEQLHLRRSETPDAEPLPAGVAVGVPVAISPGVSAGAAAAPATSLGIPAAVPTCSGYSSGTAASQQQRTTWVTEQRWTVSPSPPPQDMSVPPEDQSVVKGLITATGTGCRDIIAPHASAPPPASACWVSRGHRMLLMESSCTLQLCRRSNLDVTLRITFADAASVPRLVRLEHAPTPITAFERLGEIKLQTKSLQQPKHLFRLGKNLEVQRCLRITLVGHMADVNSGAHRVSYLLLTSSAQARSETPTPTLDAAAASAGANGAAPQASAGGPRQLEQSTADSAVSGAPAQPSPAHSSATPPVPEVQLVSARSSEPRVPPLPLDKPGNGAALTPAAAPEPTQQLPADQPGRGRQLPQQVSGGQPQPAVLAMGLPAAAKAAAAVAAVAPDTQPRPKAAEMTAAAQVRQSVGDASALAESASATSAASSTSIGTAEQAEQSEQQQLASAATKLRWEGLLDHQVQDTVWGLLSKVKADVNFQELAEEFAALQQGFKDPPKGSGSQSSPGMMLLPPERCSFVANVLSCLQLAPDQAKAALLQVLEARHPSLPGPLTHEQLADLLDCLPSPEEKALLSGYSGSTQEMGAAEQFMLEMMRVPALEERLEAWRFSCGFDGRIMPVQEAAMLLSSACEEVRHSDVLPTILKVALLVGNFLNAGNHNGAAAGFQIDALLKLKDVKSSRARSRTLLHFLAREVARQRPDGASLSASLPSAAAAAKLDMHAVRAELKELAAAVGCLEDVLASVEEAVAAAGGDSSSDAGVARMAAFQAAALDRLTVALAQIEDAQAAFKQLGSFINGQRSTLAEPASFFGVLHAFAAELDAAHEENAAADAAAGKAAAAKDGKQRRKGAGGRRGSPTASIISRDSSRRRLRSSTQENLREAVRQKTEATPSECSLQASLAGMGHAKHATSATSTLRRRSPHRSQSAAVAAPAGGGRAAEGNSAGAGSPPRSASPTPAASSITAAALLSAAASQQMDEQPPQKLRTPVANLVAETARIISSLNAPPGSFGSTSAGGTCSAAAGGFGSAIASEAAGTSCGTSALHEGSPAAADTASPPPPEAAAAAARADCITPEHAPPRRWQEEQDGCEGVQQRQQQPDGAQGWQARYRATTSAEEEAPASAQAVGGPAAAAAAGRRLASSVAASQQGLAHLRQRSMHHLSPTSTPLSSLGRQSSRSSMHSDGGSTPGSSMRFRGSLMARSQSPLGLGATEAAGGQPAATAAAAQQAALAPEPSVTPPRLPAAELLSPPRASLMPAGYHHQQEQATPGAAQRFPQAEARHDADDGQVVFGDEAGLQATASAAVAAACAAAASAADVAAVRPAMQRTAAAASAAGPGMHSRASSCDLTFYAPFSMDREGQQAFQHGHRDTGLAASFDYDQAPASPWRPLAARKPPVHGPLGGGLLRRSMDDLAVPHARAAAADAAGARQRGAATAPNSPRGPAGSSAVAAGVRRPQLLNLRGLEDRLQLRASVKAGSARSSSQLQHRQQPQPQQPEQQAQAISPVLEALLQSVPTPTEARQEAEPCVDDLADLCGFTSSDHEAEWQQLERIQEQDAQRQRQQVLEREEREAALLQQQARALSGQPQQHPGRRSLRASQEHLAEWLHQQQQQEDEQAAAAAAAEEEQQRPLQHGRLQLQLQLAPLELGALPSPITAFTANLDAALAKLLASAGNTPTGPLGQGVRHCNALAEAHQSQSVPRTSAALLEPVMPAPLGEGIRASNTLAEQVPPEVLRLSMEQQRAMLLGGSRPASVAGSRPSSAAPPGLGSRPMSPAQQVQVAAAWAAGHELAAARPGAAWDSWQLEEGGYGARRHRRKGLRKFLGKQH